MPAAPIDVVDPGPGPEQTLIEQERTRILANEIRPLPAYQRSVVEMYYSEHRKYDEIAVRLSVSIGAVKSRIHRGRSSLRERLVRHEGMFPEAHPH